MDLESGRTIRLNDPQPAVPSLKQIGWLTPGDVIRLDVDPVRRPTPPHVEDARWKPASVRKTAALSNEELRRRVAPQAFASIEAAFGAPAIKGRNRNAGWKPGAGVRSLATLSVRYVRSGRDSRGTVRVALRDEANTYWDGIPFQDFVMREHATACRGCGPDGYLATVKSEFDANRCLVRVGLTRPFAPDGGDPACWLQVTNILARPRRHFVSRVTPAQPQTSNL
jgi:hypothetical protein